MRCRFTLHAILFLTLCYYSIAASAQSQSEWIAPEGKIINNRTLLWSDFLGRPDKDEDPRAGAAVRPVIYFVADSAEEHPNERVTFKFHVKCAFQSAAWVKEVVEKEHTYFYLNHEQDHYDIALTLANKLQADLSGHDYSLKNYNKEIDNIYHPLMDEYFKVEDDYDNESDHSLIKEIQTLWDYRIKKGLENNTDDFYSKPLNVVIAETQPGQTVKRIPGEPARKFATRCRPLYSELTEELCAKIVETKEWTPEKTVIAFYTQKYVLEQEDQAPKNCTRLLAFAFMPMPNNVYKRVLIDTFTNEDKPVNIAAVFFTNADTDKVNKELVIMTTSSQRSKEISGTLYTTRVYGHTTPHIFPAKLKRLDDAGKPVEGGFEGTLNGKPSHAKCKTQKDVEDQLKKLGYQ